MRLASLNLVITGGLQSKVIIKNFRDIVNGAISFMRNGQTRCDLSVRLIIISLGKFNGCVIMLVFDVAVQKFSSEHNFAEQNLWLKLLSECE